MLFQAADIIDLRGDTVKMEPLGIGKPVKVELVSVYVGRTGRDSGELLVMSTARNADAQAGSVVAMNWWGQGVNSQEMVPLNDGTPGSRVIYYSPAESAKLLSVSVKLKFDYFPRDVYEAWAKASINIANLPILIGGMALGGPAGVAGAQAIVGVAEAGTSLGIALLDKSIDGTELTSMDWGLSIGDEGSTVQRAGFVLLTDENHVVEMHGQVNNVVAGYTTVDGYQSASEELREFLEVDTRSFYVDGEHRVLRHATDGSWDDAGWTFNKGDRVRGPWPYALVKVHGTKDESLKKWKPAAVTAELAAKFLNRERDAELPELTEKVFTAYSDALMINRAAELEKSIKDEQVDTRKKLLQNQRAAVLDSIQNEKLRELLTGES